jgi:Cys-rich repeat protein
MNKVYLTVSLLLSALATTACVEPDTGGVAGRVIIEQPCAADADCPAGFECEIEVEHGVTTSFCQSHGGDDGGGVCPPGYELEVEHGENICKPHGGDDDGGGGGSGSGSGSDDDGGTGTGTGGQTCATDADCGAGLECEIELEHGVTTATCQPHGGD